MRTCAQTRTTSKLLIPQMVICLCGFALGCFAVNAWAQSKPSAGDLLNNIAPINKATPELKKRSDKLLIESTTDQARDISEIESTTTLAISFEVQTADIDLGIFAKQNAIRIE